MEKINLGETKVSITFGNLSKFSDEQIGLYGMRARIGYRQLNFHLHTSIHFILVISKSIIIFYFHSVKIKFPNGSSTRFIIQF
jgi:hypothetical protein